MHRTAFGAGPRPKSCFRSVALTLALLPMGDIGARAIDVVQDGSHELLDGIRKAGSLRELERAFGEVKARLDDGACGEPMRAELRRNVADALRQNRQARLKSLEKGRNLPGFKTLLELKKRLDQCREEALRVINDPRIYIPEDRPGWSTEDVKGNGQLRVDQAVEAVRKTWNYQARLGLNRQLRNDIDQIRAIDERFLPGVGESPSTDERAPFAELFCNVDQPAVTIRSIALSPEEAKRHDWNRWVEKYNAALSHADVSKAVKEHVRIVNDYREMSGLRQCFIEPRLCRASEKHSAVCDKAGSIWHVGSDGSPDSRAKAAGFTGSIGENVASG